MVSISSRTKHCIESLSRAELDSLHKQTHSDYWMCWDDSFNSLVEDILSKDDGPITAHVAISRALFLAAGGCRIDVLADALASVLADIEADRHWADVNGCS